MSDLFISYEIVMRDEKLGQTLGECPYRDFELIEFYKTIKNKSKNTKIVAIALDIENHCISFQFSEFKENSEQAEKNENDM